MNGDYKIVITKAAQRDKEKLKQYPALVGHLQNLLDVIKVNPFQYPPPYKKLVGDLNMLYSRRINSKHRLVYMVYEKEKTVKIVSMWTHYEF